MLKKLAERISKGDWGSHHRDKDIEPHLQVRDELSIAEGLIFRENRIILPQKLQKFK